MKFQLSLILFCVLSFENVSTAQQLNERVDYITLNVSDPRTFHRVFIEIIKRQKEVAINVKSSSDNMVKKYKIDRTFTIEENLFMELVNDIIALNNMDLNKAFSVGGYDRTYYTLQYGGNNNSISYNIWTPNSLTEQRGLTNFLALCNKIIEISGLKSEDNF